MENKGRFQKGNTYGRKKGKPNVKTSEMKEALAKLFNDNVEQLQDDLMKLSPDQRFKRMLELAQYIVPKLKAMDMDITDKNNPVIPRIKFVDAGDYDEDGNKIEKIEESTEDNTD